MKPLISIIIPTFNSGKSLNVALTSISNQTYHDIEVLVVDGLSTDNTLKIVENFKERITKLRIISEADNGIYDAMNKGVKLANGNWIYFMGSDDHFYDSKVLEKFSNFNNLLLSDVLYGNVISTRFNGVYDGKFSAEKLIYKNICHQSIFFRKEIFKKTGLFNLKYKAHADWDHNIKWFYNKTIKKQYLDMVIANYADGGYSSIHGDEVFKKDKFKLILFRGFRLFSIRKLMSILKEIFITKFKPI